MFFFAFQEFLKYHNVELQKIQQEVIQEYLTQYITYCNIHHLYHNLHDVSLEISKQNN